MRELRVLSAFLLIAGVIGMLTAAWLQWASPLFYKVEAVRVVSSQPGMVKVEITRTSTIEAAAFATTELHCDINGAETVASLHSAYVSVEKGTVCYHLNIPFTARAFDGNREATCFIVGKGIMEIAPYLPPVTATWRTEPFVAYRPTGG